MRKLLHLSPTSISMFEHDPTAFYLRYLSENRPPKEPQTLPMAVGSAFDAYVKSYLHEALIGKKPEFERDALFEAQVEPQHRDACREAADHVLANYKRLGALDGLLVQLGKSVGPPRFEMDVRGTIHGGRTGTVQQVVFNGKPDLFYVNEMGAHVILDWKVNGWESKSGASPMKGYVKLREDGALHSAHDEATIVDHKGIFINVAKGIESYNEDWARQLTIYSWLCGEEVGAQFVAQVHQVVCRPGQKLPRIRVAEHASFINAEYQRSVFDRAAAIWDAVNSDHVFRHLTKDESIARCKLLDERSAPDVAVADPIGPGW